MRHFALALAATLCSLPAAAEIVTYDFTGIVNSVREWNFETDRSRGVVRSSVVPGTVGIGDTFHGQFAYDTELPAPWGLQESTRYFNPLKIGSTPASLIFDESGTSILLSGETSIDVTNTDDYWDSIRFDPAHDTALYSATKFSLDFRDSTAKVFDIQAIPSNIDLDAFYSAETAITWFDRERRIYVEIYGMVTTLDRVSPIPEPSSLALLFAGLGIVGGAAFRQRKRIAPVQG